MPPTKPPPGSPRSPDARRPPAPPAAPEPDLAVEELEERVIPRLASNHNETRLEVR